MPNLYTGSFVTNDKKIDESKCHGFTLEIDFQEREADKARNPEEVEKAKKELKKLEKEVEETRIKVEKAKKELKKLEKEVEETRIKTANYEEIKWNDSRIKYIKSILEKFYARDWAFINCVSYKELEDLLAGKVGTLYYVDDDDTIQGEIKLK